MELKFHCVNMYGDDIYIDKNDTPIIKLGDSYYTLYDTSDINSDPHIKLGNSIIKIVEKFN